MRTYSNEAFFLATGFTLIEIVIVLTLLGILSATALPKYFDLHESAEKRAAQSAVAAAQARVELRFGQLLMQGYSCEKATEEVANISNLADSTDNGARFGDFLLSLSSGETISTAGSEVFAKSYNDTSGETKDTGVKLYLPLCDGMASRNFGQEDVRTDIIETAVKVMADSSNYTGSTNIVDSGAASIPGSAAYLFVNTLREQGLDMANLGANSWRYDGGQKMLYWTNQDISTMSAGATVPVIRYNQKSGTYTVWIATIKNTGKTQADESQKFNVFTSYIAYSPSTNQDSKEQTYDNAMALLKQAQEVQKK